MRVVKIYRGAKVEVEINLDCTVRVNNTVYGKAKSVPELKALLKTLSEELIEKQKRRAA